MVIREIFIPQKLELIQYIFVFTACVFDRDCPPSSYLHLFSLCELYVQ